MWGAVIGDLAGSIYEYNQLKKVSKIEVDEIIPKDAFFSDDTILTVAIADAMLSDKNFKEKIKKYALEYLEYEPDVKPYFERPFSPNFIKWATSENDENGRSTGNGAMMRISPVAYLSKNLDEVKKYTRCATEPSHDTDEAILSAELVSSIIYFARYGMSKEEIIRKLNISYEYQEFKKFNYTCSETLDNCLYAVFESNSFEDAIKLVISFGGDTDTNACITGAMAEALYGIDERLIEKAKEKLPESFTNIIDEVYNVSEKIDEKGLADIDATSDEENIDINNIDINIEL